ncbi:MAG: S8 family peptidase [Desertifilum sp.]|nr:S8 family peptidase [Oscillatoria laete-virens]MCD8485637.1 S8 family peptidase [Desertifilum sp.]MDL5055176.1 S8 family peptidase [Oscillatoria laete-virens NRMC-F 0139]
MTPEKISPGLLLALQDYDAAVEQGDRLGLFLQKRTLGIVAAEDSPKPPRSVVFIYCDENANLDHLAEIGVRVNQRQGSVRTAIAPINCIGNLSDDPAVHRIKPSRYLHTSMDRAVERVKLPQYKLNNNNLTGKNVVVGVVDTGIDPKHPAFQGRVLRIWDQTLPGRGVKEGGYGVELQDPILTTSIDENGHGTHVAGIAAGQDSLYGGVAPEADLVIVKTDLQDAHIADGIRYIFRVAGELGRPAVVNLSLGGHADAHDGSDSLSQIIDAESGPGRIVCCAAGNEGNDNIHAQATVSGGRTHTMRFHIPSDRVGIAWLNGWYSGNCEFEVSVRTPLGFVTPFQKIIPTGNPVKEYKLPDATIQVVTPDRDPANGDYNFFVQIRGGMFKPSLKGGTWQLRLRNLSERSGRVDVWTLDPSASVLFTGNSVADSVKIGSPGASASAITVASYTTKTKWMDIDGTPREVGLEFDTISEFSSEGPLRNQAQKPDIAAPGAMIVAALSSDSAPERANRVNSRFVVLAGTSMATPFVSGVVALLLQSDPTLEPEVIKERLREVCAIPGKPPLCFDPKWGYGLIDLEKL